MSTDFFQCCIQPPSKPLLRRHAVHLKQAYWKAMFFSPAPMINHGQGIEDLRLQLTILKIDIQNGIMVQTVFSHCVSWQYWICIHEYAVNMLTDMNLHWPNTAPTFDSLHILRNSSAFYCNTSRKIDSNLREKHLKGNLEFNYWCKTDHLCLMNCLNFLRSPYCTHISLSYLNNCPFLLWVQLIPMNYEWTINYTAKSFNYFIKREE